LNRYQSCCNEIGFALNRICCTYKKTPIRYSFFTQLYPNSGEEITTATNMYSILTSFSKVEDLTPLLDELNTQADTVLASVFVTANVQLEHDETTETEAKSKQGTVLREHGTVLETGFVINKLNAEFITDERTEAWVDAASNAAERHARRECLQRFTAKLHNLEKCMAKLKDGLIGLEDGS
jgi:hypothetical protein